MKEIKITVGNSNADPALPTYKATTVKELFAMITEENKQRFLEDFIEMVDKVAKYQPDLEIIEYKWTDDKKPNGTESTTSVATS